MLPPRQPVLGTAATLDERWLEATEEMLGEVTGVLRLDAAVEEEDARETLGPSLADTGADGPRTLLRKSTPADFALTGTGADLPLFITFPDSFLGPFPESLGDF